MSNITPIQTKFDGRFFRSRTEARWAVFFKALGLQYEYEKEGVNLDGTWYLPDFWLPAQDVWVEVKGETPTMEEDAKCRHLATLSGRKAHIVVGQPQPMAAQWRTFDPSGLIEHSQVLMADRRNEGEWWLQRFDANGQPVSRERLGKPTGDPHDRYPVISDALTLAYTAALSERFA